MLQRRSILAELRQSIEALEGVVASLKEAVAERDRRLRQWERELAEKARILAKRQQDLEVVARDVLHQHEDLRAMARELAAERAALRVRARALRQREESLLARAGLLLPEEGPGEGQGQPGPAPGVEGGTPARGRLRFRGPGSQGSARVTGAQVTHVPIRPGENWGEQALAGAEEPVLDPAPVVRAVPASGAADHPSAPPAASVPGAAGDMAEASGKGPAGLPEGEPVPARVVGLGGEERVMQARVRGGVRPG